MANWLEMCTKFMVHTLSHKPRHGLVSFSTIFNYEKHSNSCFLYQPFITTCSADLGIVSWICYYSYFLWCPTLDKCDHANGIVLLWCYLVLFSELLCIPKVDAEEFCVLEIWKLSILYWLCLSSKCLLNSLLLTLIVLKTVNWST